MRVGCAHARDAQTVRRSLQTSKVQGEALGLTEGQASQRYSPRDVEGAVRLILSGLAMV